MRYSALLISLLAYIFITHLFHGHPLLSFAVPLVFVATFVAGLYSIIRDRTYVRYAAAAVTLGIGAQLVSYFVLEITVLIVAKVAAVFFLATTVIAILRAVFEENRITADTIAGSVCVYVLIGVTWALLYSLVAIVDGGSFMVGGKVSGPLILEQIRLGVSPRFVYFSFVTLTTLGYGDITPLSGVARSLVIVEALVGPLYLTVMVARLVGLHIAVQSNDRETK